MVFTGEISLFSRRGNSHGRSDRPRTVVCMARQIERSDGAYEVEDPGEGSFPLPHYISVAYAQAA